MTWCGLAPSLLSPFTCPCSALLVLYSHFVILAIKMPVPGVRLGFASAAAKDGRPYTNIPTTHLTTETQPPAHPLASLQNGLGCTLLPHHTSPALLTSPTPHQRELVCGACTVTAQVGTSLVAPLGFIFKRSSLRFSHDMINNSVTYIMKLKKEKKILTIAKDATVRTPKVRLHTCPVCYLALIDDCFYYHKK